MQALLSCVLYDCCKWYDGCGTRNTDPANTSTKNEECKHNNRDDNVVVVATEEGCACIPRGSHGPAVGNSHAQTTVRVVSAVFLQRRHRAIDDTPACRERVGPLATVNTSETRTLWSADA